MPKNTRQKKNLQSAIDWKRRVKEIRPYVNFKIDLRYELTPAQKRKVRKYHDEIAALTSRPFQVYRPRKRANLEQAQEFAQHARKLPGLKVAFIPTEGKTRVKVKVGKRGVRAVAPHFKVTEVRLSRRKLARDALKHTTEQVRDVVGEQFTIQAGRYEIAHAYRKDTVARAVARLTAKYNNKGANNYFGKWLGGLKVYQFTNQADAQAYFRDKANAIKKGKRARKSSKRARLTGRH